MKPLLQQALCEMLHGRLMLGGAVFLGDAGVLGVRHHAGGYERIGAALGGSELRGAALGGSELPGAELRGIDRIDQERLRVEPASDRVVLASDAGGFDPDLLVHEEDVIGVLSLKTGIPAPQVEASFTAWTRGVKDALSRGGEVELSPLGRFTAEDGPARFLASDRLAVEVNHRHAGCREIVVDWPSGSDVASGPRRRGKRRPMAVLLTFIVILGVSIPASLHWGYTSGAWAPTWLTAWLSSLADVGSSPSTHGLSSKPSAPAPAPPHPASPAHEASLLDMSDSILPEPSLNGSSAETSATETSAAETSAAAADSGTPYGLTGIFDPILRNAYTLVLFTFSESERAAHAAVPLLEAGYRLEIVTRWKGDQPFWLLCVGQFETREQALEALATLDDRYRSDYSILSLP